MSETPQLFRLWRGDRVHRTDFLSDEGWLVACCGRAQTLVYVEEHDERGVPTDVTCKQCLKRNPST